MKAAICKKTYFDGDEEWLCMLLAGHAGPCAGHRTSRDIVPEDAEAVVISHAGSTIEVRVFRDSDLDVFLAYAPPPYDCMAQGRPKAGKESAIESLLRTLRAEDVFSEADAAKIAGLPLCDKSEETQHGRGLCIRPLGHVGDCAVTVTHGKGESKPTRPAP
jgi:hypothetical protein